MTIAKRFFGLQFSLSTQSLIQRFPFATCNVWLVVSMQRTEISEEGVPCAFQMIGEPSQTPGRTQSISLV